MAIVPSPFDAEAFGRPFYRVRDLDDALAEDVRGLVARQPRLVIDAKVPSGDLTASRRLWASGFRKVCMQITLRHDLRGDLPRADGVAIASRLDLPQDEVLRHAENFRFDRFSLDPLLPREGVRRLYAGWIANSLTGLQKTIVHSGGNFCTLTADRGGAVIDLVSVLEPGRGVGRALVAAACGLARERGAPHLLVTTECENDRAWQLYVRSGFVPARFTSVFHLVHEA